MNDEIRRLTAEVEERDYQIRQLKRGILKLTEEKDFEVKQLKRENQKKEDEKTRLTRDCERLSKALALAEGNAEKCTPLEKENKHHIERNRVLAKKLADIQIDYDEYLKKSNAMRKAETDRCEELDKALKRALSSITPRKSRSGGETAAAYNPDSYYTSALERIRGLLTDWTIKQFSANEVGKYTDERVEGIRTGLKKLLEINNLIPKTVLWKEINLKSALDNSEFRVAFVQHVIALHLHEVFMRFSYEIENFGLGYWLKRFSDQISKSGCMNHNILLFINSLDVADEYLQREWSKLLIITIPDMFDGSSVEQNIFKSIKCVLRHIYPRAHSDAVNDTIFEELKTHLSEAISVAVTMRLESCRFISTFPIKGARFVSQRHSIADENNQSGAIRMCVFPGIIKQKEFLGASKPTDVSIFKANVYLESWNKVCFADVKV